MNRHKVRNLFAAEPSKQQEGKRHGPTVQLSRPLLRRTTSNKCSELSPVTPAHSAQLCRHITGAFIELRAAFYATTPTRKTLFRKPTCRPSPTLRAIAAKGTLRTGCPASLSTSPLGRIRQRHSPIDLVTLEQQQGEAQIIQFPQSTPNDDPERTMAQRQ